MKKCLFTTLMLLSTSAFSDSVISKLPKDWSFVVGECAITKDAQTENVKFYVPMEKVAEMKLYSEGEGHFDNTYSLYINNMASRARIGIRSTCPRCFENPPYLIPEYGYEKLYKELMLPSPQTPSMVFTGNVAAVWVLNSTSIMGDYEYSDESVSVVCDLKNI